MFVRIVVYERLGSTFITSLHYFYLSLSIQLLALLGNSLFEIYQFNKLKIKHFYIYERHIVNAMLISRLFFDLLHLYNTLCIQHRDNRINFANYSIRQFNTNVLIGWVNTIYIYISICSNIMQTWALMTWALPRAFIIRSTLY